MAKVSAIQRNLKRIKLAKKFLKKRKIRIRIKRKNLNLTKLENKRKEKEALFKILFF